MFCPKLPEDIANKLVIRSGPNYYYPNREPIPRDTGTSVMDTGKSSQNAPKAPPGNQEANKNPPEPRKRRPSYPGAWVEGTSDDGSTEDGEPEIVEESLKKPEKNLPKDLEKNKRKEPEKEAEDELVLARPVEKSKVGGGLKKKIFKQKLQDLAEDDGKPPSRSQNSGRCDHRDFDGEHHNNHRSGALGSIKRSLTYACPLGFVYITMGSTKVKALVDTGAEMNIMPESLAIQLQLPYHLDTSDDDAGLADSDLGTTDNDSRITDEDSRTTVSELGTSASTPSISKDDSESPEILVSQSWEDWTSKQDNPEFIRADGTHFEDCYKDKEDPWISPEHPPSSENWDTHWNPVSLFIPPEQEKEFRICGMMTANYIDQGYPVKEFLRMYPETRGSNADEIWAELPGYTAGRIGFIMLLNWTGTRGYMENDVIWLEDWWVVPIERYGMYIGDGRGLIVTKEQRMWYNSRDRTEEEEQFLSSVIAKMVVLGGGFNYEAFKWALQDEQQRLGVKFETFWKEWEYSAFCL
ncbi:hypothetical protein KEM48_005775 [Puccinia striiformis f. sp. tritici PST-130]|nr:hypothetical protein KEM48_005775 [Puccinia striiformis f. sp. tritici PST-130]